MNILSFPAEIFGLVFAFATAGCEIEDLVNLALVCTQFRDIIFVTPELWTDLIVTYTDKTDLSKLIDQLKTSLMRSGDLPVQLTLRCQSVDLPPKVELLTDFLLSGLVRRVEGLNLSAPLCNPADALLDVMVMGTDWLSEILGNAANDTKPFQNVKFLSLSFPGKPIRLRSKTFDKGFPNLKVLDLDCSPFYRWDTSGTFSMSSDWPCLQLRGLQKLTVKACISAVRSARTSPLHTILLQGPDLQSLDLSVGPLYVRLGTLATTPLIHETLSELTLKGRFEALARQLLTVVLPNLRSLRLEGKGSSDTCNTVIHPDACIVTNVRILIRESGCELEDLVFVNTILTDDQLSDLRSCLGLARVTVV
ncbi:hypothetical protein CC2G_010896 [Coprinopsis cinerea AmutBmut pab1-1]|nr:hypothetical protein CC2G_010896 [Coprinopsis cinerea AmutBmut pab1-1]